MSLSDYTRINDNFVYHEDAHTGRFSFPCCVCKNNIIRETEDPCRSCGHNENQAKPSFDPDELEKAIEIGSEAWSGVELDGNHIVSTPNR